MSILKKIIAFLEIKDPTEGMSDEERTEYYRAMSHYPYGLM